IAFRRQGKLDLAIADYSRAIEIDPDYAAAYKNRGIVYQHRGIADRRSRQLDLAIADYKKVIEIDPEDALAFNNLARLLATVPYSYKRDGKKAAELAEKAVALKPEYPPYMDTLAAAYAEIAEFAEAVRTQEQAIELLKAQGKDEYVSDYESRLKLYQQSKPFRSQPKISTNQQPSG
ncbi:MAG: tetratricopeptide repeat protein, partial [Hyphomicrobiales bacterium]|nr:tetratricopeptide repeat protein [Hyphomicrobiales bacterium]